jgi:tetratricopeptide (TPR) repeat protein
MINEYTRADRAIRIAKKLINRNQIDRALPLYKHWFNIHLSYYTSEDKIFLDEALVYGKRLMKECLWDEAIGIYVPIIKIENMKAQSGKNYYLAMLLRHLAICIEHKGDEVRASSLRYLSGQLSIHPNGGVIKYIRKLEK